MSAHTPGPSTCLHCVAVQSSLIANPVRLCPLHAAAPALLKVAAALAGLESDGEIAFPTMAQINEARTAIRAAKGETA